MYVAPHSVRFHMVCNLRKLETDAAPRGCTAQAVYRIEKCEEVIGSRTRRLVHEPENGVGLPLLVGYHTPHPQTKTLIHCVGARPPTKVVLRVISK